MQGTKRPAGELQNLSQNRIMGFPAYKKAHAILVLVLITFASVADRCSTMIPRLNDPLNRKKNDTDILRVGNISYLTRLCKYCLESTRAISAETSCNCAVLRSLSCSELIYLTQWTALSLSLSLPHDGDVIFSVIIIFLHKYRNSSATYWFRTSCVNVFPILIPATSQFLFLASLSAMLFIKCHILDHTVF